MEHTSIEIPEPRLARLLFSDTRLAWVWLALRIYVGYQWAFAGWEKLTGGWIGAQAGTALQGFFAGVLQKVGGAHPIVSSWYGYFIEHFAMNHTVVFSYIISFGEFSVGLGLILGAFAGVAAFFGAFMNFNYLLAGTVSMNPTFFLLGILLILAWRVAGYIGIDYFLLPKISSLLRSKKHSQHHRS